MGYFNPLSLQGTYLVTATRDIAPEVTDANGRLKIMPASYYEAVAPADRVVACVKNGWYGLHTQELVDYLRELIKGRSAIEICAGNGVLAEALGITATDNHMQAEPAIKDAYNQLKQACVTYGPNVERLDAISAVSKYRPDIVIACWMTHRYDPQHPEREGNMYGPREKDILRRCKKLIMIGNTHTHRNHPLLSLRHARLDAPWLYSRAVEGTDFVGIWKGKRF